MDFLAPNDPAKPGTKFQLVPQRFLGGAIGTIEGPGDFQGCSEFNPQLILAGEEIKPFSTEGDIGKQLRHAVNDPNRRVIIYLFEPGTTKPTTWPCPSARQGIAGCRARFWSDGDDRRNTTLRSASAPVRARRSEAESGAHAADASARSAHAAGGNHVRLPLLSQFREPVSVRARSPHLGRPLVSRRQQATDRQRALCGSHGNRCRRAGNPGHDKREWHPCPASLRRRRDDRPFGSTRRP